MVHLLRPRAVLGLVVFASAVPWPAWTATPTEADPTAAATAQPESSDPADPLQVIAIEIEPFTMLDGDVATGYAVEIWDEIGDRAGLISELSWVDDMEELLTSVATGQSDAGIGPISMTPAREERLDFTYPFSTGGLGIMVSASDPGPLGAIVDAFAHPGWVVLGLLLAGVIILVGLAAWLPNRGRQGWPTELRHGFHEGAWRSARAFLGGDFQNEPATGLGRLAAMTWIVAGIVLTSLFTAALTSSATVSRLEGSIDGPEDLAGQRIVTLADSTSEEWLTAQGLPYRTVTSIEDASSLLREGSADAVVFDQLVLRYHTSKHGGGDLEVVGPAFDLDPYGFALPEESPLRERIDEALLSMIHDGTIDRLHTAWFGPTT